MAISVELNVGPQAVAAGDGTDISSRAGRTGDQIVSELHGRYFEQMRSGKMFSAANQAAQATSVALATTYTGILLYNPVNSGKLLVPNKIKYALSAAPAALSNVGLLAGFAATGGVTAQTVKLTVQSNQIGNSALGVGLALSSATITTPTYIAQMFDSNPATALSSPVPLLDLEGVFGILPGGFIGVATLTTLTGYGFMSWEEVDLPL